MRGGEATLLLLRRYRFCEVKGMILKVHNFILNYLRIPHRARTTAVLQARRT